MHAAADSTCHPAVQDNRSSKGAAAVDLAAINECRVRSQEAVVAACHVSTLIHHHGSVGQHLELASILAGWDACDDISRLARKAAGATAGQHCMWPAPPASCTLGLPAAFCRIIDSLIINDTAPCQDSMAAGPSQMGLSVRTCSAQQAAGTDVVFVPYCMQHTVSTMQVFECQTWAGSCRAAALLDHSA